MKTVGYLPKATKSEDDADKVTKTANGNGGKGGNKPANTDGKKADGADGGGNKPADDKPKEENKSDGNK